jgi:hypothetical protein
MKNLLKVGNLPETEIGTLAVSLPRHPAQTLAENTNAERSA